MPEIVRWRDELPPPPSSFLKRALPWLIVYGLLMATLLFVGA